MSSDRNREALSAMLDGEAGELELRRLLRDMSDEEVSAWSRWQLARDAVRGRAVTKAPEGFSASLRQGLTPQASGELGLMGHVSRAGVAASVAVAVIFGWQYFDGGTADTGGAVPQEVVQVEMPERRDGPPALGEAATVSAGGSGSATQAVPAGLEGERMNSMLMRHSESAARHSGQAMVPYVRLISLDSLQEDR